MRAFAGGLAFLLGATLCPARDLGAWDALSRLQSGERVRLSVRGRTPLVDTFRSWDAEQVTVGAVVTKRPDVVKVERFRVGKWGRGKKAALGALIGGGGGAAIGAAGGSCRERDFICFTRGQTAAILGVLGAVVGATIGALLPTHRTELIYETR